MKNMTPDKLSKKKKAFLFDSSHTVCEQGKLSAHIWKLGVPALSDLPLLVVVHHSSKGDIASIPFVIVKSLDGNHSIIPFPNENGHKFVPVGEKMGKNMRQAARKFAEALIDEEASVLDIAIEKWEKAYGPIKLVYAEPETIDRDKNSFELYKMPFILRVHLPDHGPMHAHVYYVDPKTNQRTYHTRFKFLEAQHQLYIVHFPFQSKNGQYKEEKQPVPEALMPAAYAIARENAEFIREKWIELNKNTLKANDIEHVPSHQLPKWSFVRALQAQADKRQAEETQEFAR